MLTPRLTARVATGGEFVAFAAKLLAAPSRDRESGVPYEDWRFEPAAALTARGAIEDQHRLWLAIADRSSSEIVGLAELLLPASDGMAWIGLLVIEPRRRNCGLGGELLAGLERSLAAEGWTELRLSVALANDGARRFWEREGYRELQGAWRCYHGLPPTSIVLSKPLQAPLSR